MRLRLAACLILAGCGTEPERLPRIASFTVQPARVSPGDVVTLTWETFDVPGVVVDPRVGVGDPVGFATDRPFATTTYVLSVPDGSGLRAETTLQVTGGPRLLGLSAEPRTVFAGETSRLRWDSVDAEGVQLTAPDAAPRTLEPRGAIEVQPRTTTVYRMQAFAGEQISETAEVTVVVGGTGAPRILALEATPQSIRRGEEVRLRWDTEDATRVSFDQGLGVQTVDGEISVRPDRTTSYTLTAAGPGGTTQASISVQVTSTAPPKVLLFEATPARVALGDSVTLRWDTADATGVDIQPGVGGGPVKGELEVRPTENTTYTLSAYGGGGQTMATAEVEVVREGAPVILDLRARPAVVYAGGESEIVWSTRDARELELQPLGSVDPSGTVRVTPAATTTYELIARNQGLEARRSITVEVELAPPRVVLFQAAPSTVEAGRASEIEWRTENATEVVIEPGLGPQPVAGRARVAPRTTTTYTLNARSNAGAAAASLRVTVTPPGAPSVDRFSVAPPQIRPGQVATLAWRVTGSSEVRLDRGLGIVPTTGSTTVAPSVDTTYTLTAGGPGGQSVAQASVTVVPLTGDVCSEAFPVRSSGSYTGDTRTGTDDYRDVSSCTGNRQQGDDIVYRVDLQAGDRIRATLAPEGASTHDLSLYLLSDCANPSRSCVAGSDRGNPEEIDFTTPTAGDFFVVVDGFPAGGSPYRLEVTLNPAPVVNDDCSGAIDVTVGGTFAGDTSSARNLYSPVDSSGQRSCTGYRARGHDVTYQVNLSAGERLQAEVDAAWDASLYLVEDCARAGDSCVQGSDRGNPERVDFTAARAGTYFLIVDAYGTAQGPFSLDVQVSPPAAGGNTCQGPVRVPAAGAGFLSTTLGMQNVYGASQCFGTPQLGADRVYAIDLQEGDVVRAAARATGLDASLYVLDDCAQQTCVAATDDAGAGGTERLRFVARRSGDHFVVVDAPRPATADHELLVVRNTGETCSEAAPLRTDGSAEWTTTRGLRDDYAASGCVATAPTGPDRTFEVEMEAGLQLDVRLRALAGNPALYVLQGCSNPTGACVAGSDGTGDEHVAPVFARDQTVWVVVDEVQGTADAELQAFLRDGDTCTDPYRVPDRGGLFMGTTAGKGADLGTTRRQGSCTGYEQAGADVVYQVDVPAGATIEARVATSWDAALYLVRDCARADTTCLAGSDSGTPEIIRYTNSTGAEQTWFLIVDAWQASSSSVVREGSYTLAIFFR